jgi:hypothetical protein
MSGIPHLGGFRPRYCSTCREWADPRHECDEANAEAMPERVEGVPA